LIEARFSITIGQEMKYFPGSALDLRLWNFVGFEMKLKIWLCLTLVFISTSITSSSAENNAVAIRSQMDRPDDLSGYQIRLIYVVPASANDRQLDTDGTIGKWIEKIRTITSAQIGLTPRFDTFQGNQDIGFLQSKYTLAQLYGTSGKLDADELLSKELSESEQNSFKAIGFIIDGKIPNSKYCGYSRIPGKYFTAWLGVSCWEDTDWYNNRPYMPYISNIILHEWLHSLGVEHTCVTDDLMWGGGCESVEAGNGNSIDAERIHYVRAQKSGVDITLLPVWEETFKLGSYQLGFKKVTKSTYTNRNSTGLDEIWGSFSLPDNWAYTSVYSWSCEVKTSSGITLLSIVKNGFCTSKIHPELKIGTKVSMRVSVQSLWQQASDVLIFQVNGQNGDKQFCTTSICIEGETIKSSIDLCFSIQNFAKLEEKQLDKWVALKVHKMSKGEPSCSAANPYYVFTTVKGFSIGKHTLRWTSASDRAFSKAVRSYKEFNIEIKPEVSK